MSLKTMLAKARAHKLRTTLIAAATALVLAGAGTGAIVLIVQAEHDRALAAAQAEQELHLAAAEAHAAAGTSLRDAITAALDRHESINVALEGGDEFLGAEVAATLRAQLDELAQIVDELTAEGTTATTVILSTPGASSDLVPVAAADSTEVLLEAATTLGVSRVAIATDATRLQAEAAAVAAAAVDVDEALAALLEGLPDAAAALIAAYPSAGAAATEALSEAVAELNAQEPPTVAAYVAAAAALIAAHNAEVQRVAEEAAAQQQAPSRGGAGGSRPPATGGGGGGGTGGGTGGGGSTPPPTGGGGYTPPPVDQTRYVRTNSHYVPYGECYGGGSAYGSHDPGPGGTSTPSFTFPWSYQNMGTYIQWYVCG